MNWTVAVLLCLCVCLSGCSGEGSAGGGTAKEIGPSTPDAAARTGPDLHAGRQTFEFWCAPCHAAGDEHPGTRRLGERLGPELAVLLERPGLDGTYVQTVVRSGFQMMPPFRTTEISDEELNALAAYVADASRRAARTGTTP
ncbi:MAG: cytochrome c [Gammaproteobacteria bacterium]|nr:cytochrome c [Gammaproteobacteria bacterium]